jgi:hypothetical protein
LEFRPIEQLEALLGTVDPAAAKKAMERWKKEAASMSSPRMKRFESVMYVLCAPLLKEGLSNLDRLPESFNSANCRRLAWHSQGCATKDLRCLRSRRMWNAVLMVLQEIGQALVLLQYILRGYRKISTVLRRAAPLHANETRAPYRLRDYHGWEE